MAESAQIIKATFKETIDKLVKCILLVQKIMTTI